jgi:hypothetical protein
MAELILIASSLSDFQLSLFSETGLLEKFPLGLRTAMRDGRSMGLRFMKLLPSISRSGEFSLSVRGRVDEGGGANGELPALFDKNPALKRLLFFWTFNVGSAGSAGSSGTGDIESAGLATLGMFLGIGDPDRGGRDGSPQLGPSTYSKSTFWGLLDSNKAPSCSSSFQRTDRFVGLD